MHSAEVSAADPRVAELGQDGSYRLFRLDGPSAAFGLQPSGTDGGTSGGEGESATSVVTATLSTALSAAPDGGEGEAAADALTVWQSIDAVAGQQGSVALGDNPASQGAKQQLTAIDQVFAELDAAEWHVPAAAAAAVADLERESPLPATDAALEELLREPLVPGQL